MSYLCSLDVTVISIPTFLDRDEYTKTSRERRREGALGRTRPSHKPSGLHVDTWNCRAGPRCLQTKQAFRLLPERARCAPRAKQNSRGQRGEAALGVWKSSVSHLCPLVGKKPTHFIGTRCSERKRLKKKGKRNLFVPYCLYPPPLCTHSESLFSKAVGGEHRGDKAGERGPVAVLLRTTHHFFHKNKTQPQLPRVEQLNNPLKRICVCRKTRLLNSENAGWSWQQLQRTLFENLSDLQQKTRAPFCDYNFICLASGCVRGSDPSALGRSELSSRTLLWFLTLFRHLCYRGCVVHAPSSQVALISDTQAFKVPGRWRPESHIPGCRPGSVVWVHTDIGIRYKKKK